MRRIFAHLTTWLFLLGSAAFALGGCASSSYDKGEIGDPRRDLRTERRGGAVDRGEHRLRGKASWYGKDFHGRTTACGEPYDMYAFTAAHKTLPFHTIVRVTDTRTLKNVVVRITDRGPYADGRVIDLSYAAAADLGLIRRGVGPVRLEVLQWGDGSRVE